MTPRTVLRRLRGRRPVREVIERIGDRVREAAGGPRRRWTRVDAPPGALGGPHVLLDGCACPILEAFAGPEFEPDPEPTEPTPAVTWRRSDYWAPRPLVPSRYDWRTVGEPHPLGPDPAHDTRRR
jgi:hypothetical protein